MEHYYVTFQCIGDEREENMIVVRGFQTLLQNKRQLSWKIGN
jgi:hypothetical protein